MNYLTADSITLTAGTRTLLQDVSLSIEDTSRIGIVGLNGSGKSTLLTALTSSEYCDAGTITRNSSCSIHLMKQLPAYDPGQYISDYIFSAFDIPHIDTIRDYETALSAVEEGWNQHRQKELDRLSARMEELGAWDFEGKLRSLLKRFGISSLNRPLSELSGGMLKKISLAQAVMSEADLLFLDEPTNHLDIKTILWLESYLQKRTLPFILITHDRYFLDNVCNTIWEIADNRIYVHKGNFTYFLEKRRERQEAQQRKDEKNRRLLRQETAWLNRSPSARGTKQKARINRVQELMKTGRIKEQSSAAFSTSGRRLGKKILNLKNLYFAYGDTPIVNNFSYTFKGGEKIGLIGDNGVGKTTFTSLLTGRLQPQSGTVDRGMNTQTAVFSQNSHDLPQHTPVIKYIKDIAEFIEINGEKVSASALLEQFLFSKKDQYKKIDTLSGGEKRRLQLISVLITNPNFLILDEPTNDLDIETLEILEDFLNKFQGVLLIISHDRSFIDTVCDYLFVMPGKGEIFGFPAAYSDYLIWQKEEERRRKRETPAPVRSRRSTHKKKNQKLSYKEKRELESLMEEIDTLEQEQSNLEEAFGAPQEEDLKKLQLRYDDVRTELAEKMSRWEELSQRDM
ncbi:MAG: ABC-F family ATP-binding cassette domain-containing protein [Fibrobacterota bacterium]